MSEDDEDAHGPAGLVRWSPRRGPAVLGSWRLQGLPVGAAGMLAIGALAVGAVSVGALAIGALAIGRLAVGQARLRDVKINRLEVGDLILVRRNGRPF